MSHIPGISLPPHWIVGNERIYNQLIAWQRINETKQEFRFYFYEKEYDQFDWSSSPAQSWEDLLQARCIQLRQKYKNLKLFYSGGRDSHHVLRSFIKNNIPVDELVLMNYQTNPVREQEYKQILSMAIKYKDINPSVKITTIVIDKKVFDLYYRSGWIENPGITLQNGYFQPTQFSFITNQLAKVDNSSTAFILGVDKPKIIIEGDNIYTAIIDKLVELHLDTTNTIEYFYYAPDLPELHIKQCHMLLDYLEQHYPNYDTQFLGEFLDNSHSQYYDEMCHAIGRGSAWDLTLPLQNGKNKYNGAHVTFSHVLARAKDEKWKSVFYYEEMLNYFSRNLSHAFNNNDPRQGTVGIWGKKYFLRKFKSLDTSKGEKNV